MTIAIGIDTGGTYTDAAVVDHESGEVLAGAKALTTRHDLSVGIGEAIAAVFRKPSNACVKPGSDAPKGGTDSWLSPEEIDLVGLSTTLATNAIAEGHGSPVCLLLIGYEPETVLQIGAPGLFGHAQVDIPGIDLALQCRQQKILCLVNIQVHFYTFLVSYLQGPGPL